MAKAPSESSDEAMPASAALSFVAGRLKKASGGNNRKAGRGDSEAPVTERDPSPATSDLTRKKRSKPKRRRVTQQRASATKPASTQQPVPATDIYDPLSTQARQSIQAQLADLRHERRKTRHPVCTIKQFIEEAVILWLEVASDHPSHIPAARREGEPANDPYRPFNNQIRRDLAERLEDVRHQRKKVRHPVQTIKAFIDEALTVWLAKHVVPASSNQRSQSAGHSRQEEIA